MASDDFAEQAEHTLDRLEQALDACGLDYERKEGGIIEIELADGARVIVNRHAAAREIWVAARAGGFITAGMAPRGATRATGASFFRSSRAWWAQS